MNISGGTQRQALELANHLQNIGHKISVYTAYYNKEKCFPDLLEYLNVKYLFLDKRREVETRKKKPLEKTLLFLKNLLSIWLSVVREEKVYNRLADLIDRDLDLLNCHDYGVYSVAAKYKHKTNVPIVWQMNDLPVYKLNFKNFKGVLEFIISPIKLVRWWHRKYIRQMDAIMVLDNLNKKKLKDNIGVESIVIRGGLDLKKFSYIEKSSINENKLTLLSNSIFYPYRRLEDLIGALQILGKNHVKYELNHIGTDRNCKWYAEKIYKMVKKANLSDSTKFHGFVSEEKLIELYSGADIFIFPSYNQTWGLVVFEAMACGIPVIVTNSCGASEVLTNEINALIVPAKSPVKIAEAIIRLKEDHELREKLSINGRKHVEKYISWDFYAKNVADAFMDVLENKGAEVEPAAVVV